MAQHLIKLINHYVHSSSAPSTCYFLIKLYCKSDTINLEFSGESDMDIYSKKKKSVQNKCKVGE